MKYFPKLSGTYLHIECDHLSTMNPASERIVIRRIKTCTLWIYSEYISTGKPTEENEHKKTAA